MGYGVLVRSLGAAAFLVAAAVAHPAAAGAVPGPTLTASPSTGLVDGQWIDVSGAGFDGNPALPDSQLAEIFLCRSDAVDLSGCDPDNAYFVSINDDGTLQQGFRVDASIYTESGNFDCRSAVQACKIGVGLIVDVDKSVFVPIDFHPSAPLLPAVTASVTPTTGLVDGQEVSVSGEHLFPLFDSLVVQCGSAAIVPAGCDFDHAQRSIPVAADGTIETTYSVRSSFRAGTGEDYDCVGAADPCVMLVSISATESPDRLSTVPLAFAPPPVAPPAPPLPVGPAFTG